MSICVLILFIYFQLGQEEHSTQRRDEEVVLARILFAIVNYVGKIGRENTGTMFVSKMRTFVTSYRIVND